MQQQQQQQQQQKLTICTCTECSKTCLLDQPVYRAAASHLDYLAYPQRSDQWLYSLHQRVTASVVALAVGTDTEQLPVIKLARLHAD